MAHAWEVGNLASGIAASSWTWSNGASTNRAYLNDGRMDKTFSVGSVASTVNVVVDLGASTSISAIAVLNHNLSTATAPTLTIATADDSGFTTNVVTQKSTTTLNQTAPRHKDHILQFAAASRRYWKLTFAWTGSFSMTLGEIFFATPTSLTRSTIFGHSQSEKYFTTRFESYIGETRGHFLAGPYRVRSLSFADLTASQREELFSMYRETRGGSLPLLWVEKYEAVSTAAASDNQEVIWGRLEEDTLSWTEDDFGIYQPSKMTLTSLSRGVGF